MSVITEEVQLKDGISGPAKTAAASVKTLEQHMTVLKSALKASQDQMVKAQALGNTKQYAAAAKASDQLKVSLGQLDGQMQAAGGSSGSLQAELAEVTGGLSIVVEVAAAVGAAFGAVVLAGMAMAIEAVEAKEKMLSLFDALGEGKVSGQETVAMLDKLGDTIGQTRKQLAPLTQAFMTMGVTGTANLYNLTLAAASAGALAEGGAEKFTTMFGVINAAAETGSKMTIPFKKLEKQLAGVGLNIGDMAKKMNMTEAALTSGLKAGTVDAKAFGDALSGAATDKGAGPLAQAGMSLTNIWAKAQENVSKLFEDIDVKPFLAEVKDLFDIFGQGKDSGKALKAGIGGFFNETFKIAKQVVPYVKHFLLDVVIFGLKAYLAVKPLVKSFNEWRASASGMKTISTIISTIGAVLLTVAAVIGIAAAAFIGLWAVMVGIGVVIWAVIAAFIAIPQMAGAAIADFFGKAPQMAKDFITGLADGIKNGAGIVVDAVKGMAGGAVKSFKGALGISSPSKVMMQMGGHVAAGAAAGIDDGAPDVHGASADLAKAASGGFASGAKAPAAGGAAGGGAGGVNVTVEAGAIVIQGGSAASVVDLTEQAIALLFERVQLSQGL